MNFKDLMKLYEFDNFPRNVGRLRWDSKRNQYMLFQFPTYSFEQLFHEVWDVAKGHQSYVSHNSIYNGATFYRQMTFDVDTDKEGSTLEMALDDMRKLVKYFEKANKMASFSGNGFHFYLRFTEKEIPIDAVLRSSIKKFQSKLVKRLDLKTVNLSCAEPKRIIRIPGTMHSEDIEEKGIRYCIPVNEELLDEGLEAILKASKVRDTKHWIDNTDKNRLSLEKMLKLGEDIIRIQPNFENEVDISESLLAMQDFEFKEFLGYTLGENLLKKLLSAHPGNSALVYACIVISSLKISLEDAYYIFDRLAYLADWYNKENADKRHYSISKIYEGGYNIWA